MLRTLKTVSLTAALSLLCLSADAVPPSILEPASIDPADYWGDIDLQQARQSVSTSLAAPDTLYTLCPVGSKSFSPSFGGSDVWGWADSEGREYAIMGIENGIVFVDAETQAQVGFVSGPNAGCGGSRWRDIKTFGQYCYAVSECVGTNQGMMVIDMQFLPDSVHLIRTVTSFTNVTSHNLSIDTTKGYAYLVRPGYNGVRIFSLSNPENPVEVGAISTPDCHDMFARNDTVWVAEANNGTFSVWNAANKSNPQLITRVSIPASGYVHNIWPSGDGQHVITTEETAGKTVKYWSVADYSNVQLVSDYLAPSMLAHNAHMAGDTAVISHYESGVAIVDFTDPLNPIEIARYDSWSVSEQPAFNGNWGAYPYTPSGRIYLSNMNNQLIILEPDVLVTNDTLVGDSIFANPGQAVRVDVSLRNEHPIRVINIPFEWGGPLNLVIDSIGTTGLRTEYFDGQTFTAFDNSNKRAGYSLTANNVEPLPPGEGPVFSIFFTVPAGAPDDTNPIVLDGGFAGLSPEVASACLQYTAETIAGAVTVGSSADCCPTTTGNVNADPQGDVTLTDLTLLVNHLFVTFETLACPAAANTSGDPACEVSLTDLTLLVNHLFVTFEPLAACNPACN